MVCLLEECEAGEKSLGIQSFDTLQKRSHSLSVAASYISDCSEVEEGSEGDSACFFTGSARITGPFLRKMTDI